MNKITILGAFGSKSDKGGSSAFMLNDKHVIDAGNLLGPLEEKSANIETIWLTHSHLDHIIDMAYILDNYYNQRQKTLNIYGLKATLEAIKKHFFNNVIWPDFSKIPLVHGNGMTITYHEIEVGKRYTYDVDCQIEAILTEHSVPSCGYIIRKPGSSLVITADTHSVKGVVEYVQKDKSVTAMVVECSFPTHMDELAKNSKHLTPRYLFEDLRPLEGTGIDIYINHIKPSFEEVICAEIKEMKSSWNVTILKDGDDINF